MKPLKNKYAYSFDFVPNDVSHPEGDSTLMLLIFNRHYYFQVNCDSFMLSDTYVDGCEKWYEKN